MLKPLQEWVCDNCGTIVSPSEGVIEWTSDSNFKDYGFKIVHHSSFSPRNPPNYCYHYANHNSWSDLPLKDFVNDKGHAIILSFLDVGPYHDRDYKGPRLKDIREFVEFVRRLTIPYYEEARLYWNQALFEDNYFDGENELGIYFPENLKRLVEEYGD